MEKLIILLLELSLKKSAQEAKKFGDIHIAYNGADNGFKHIPTQEELDLREDASYVHLCSNNTIFGTEWKYVPDTKGVPVVADMSSNILSKPINVADYGMIYAGATKKYGYRRIRCSYCKRRSY